MIDPCRLNPVPYIMHLLGFLKDRLGEPSTWVSIGVSVTAASQLAAPWSYVSIACGIMSAMVPNKVKPS